jgi:hypothetical protein
MEIGESFFGKNSGKLAHGKNSAPKIFPPQNPMFFLLGLTFVICALCFSFFHFTPLYFTHSIYSHFYVLMCIIKLLDSIPSNPNSSHQLQLLQFHEGPNFASLSSPPNKVTYIFTPSHMFNKSLHSFLTPCYYSFHPSPLT